LYGATSIGGALTATSTFNVTGLSIFNSNVGIGTSSPYAKLSVVGEAVATYFTATSTTATSTFAGATILGNSNSSIHTLNGVLGILGSSDNSYTDDATVELITTHTAGDGSMSLLIENSLEKTSSETSQAKIARFRLKFANASGSETYTNSVNNIAINTAFQAQGDYTLPCLKGASIILSEGGTNTGTYTITNWYGLDIDDGTADGVPVGTGTFNVSGHYDGIRVGGMTGFANGTIANATGLWIDRQTIGTNNYGIVLNGVGSGADIAFTNGSATSTISYDGSDMQYNGMPLNDIGSKNVCSAWVSITNPYMCISWLTPATTETAIVASSTVFSSGLQFAYNNITASEIAPKSQVWTLNGTGGTEYLSRADSGSTFSFIDTGSNGFSVAAWVEVTDTTGTQTIIAKSGAAGNREWLFQIFNDETLAVGLSDQSASTVCSKASSGALPSIGSWHFLSFVYDGSGGDNVDDGISVYDNGVAITSMSNQDCTGYVAMEDLGQNVTIGAQGNPSNYFKGDMGHIMITDDELTADQILKLYNSSKMYYGL
jgi:hypothetical protein